VFVISANIMNFKPVLMMTLAPIALFAYNRLWHLQQTVEALQLNEFAGESDLYVFSDGAKLDQDDDAVAAVRNYLVAVRGFKSVVICKREKNIGLAHNIISGVREICNLHDRVIVMEDDLVTSPFFLKYMNEALDLYETTAEVISIHGYIYPLKEEIPESFLLRGADCWGWATWKRGWILFEPDALLLLTELERQNLCKEFDFNGSFPYTKMLRDQIAGKNNSWAIRWYASAFLQKKLTLYPGRSLVHNIGNDASGTHSMDSKQFDVLPVGRSISLVRLAPVENLSARHKVERYFRQVQGAPHQSYLSKILSIARTLCRRPFYN